MSALLIVCHNEDGCRDSIERNPENPRPMRVTGENSSVWRFQCDTCQAKRAVEKRLIGGTRGSGRTDEGRGKGLRRYTAGLSR